MANTSARLLHLLSLFGDRAGWGCEELSTRLAVSTRTVRRDVDTLRGLGYPIDVRKGPGGGYRLGTGGRLPPLVLDDPQALAIVLALQTAPPTMQGLDDAGTRALTAVKQILPTAARADADALSVTTLPNPWEFRAPPVDQSVVRVIGAAIRDGRRLRLEYLMPDGRRPAPGAPGFTGPILVEPHHLVVWAGRWYLVAFVVDGDADDRWRIYRVDRVVAPRDTGVRFSPREVPGRDVGRFVMHSHDRGDTPAQWQCSGTVVMDLPASVVARWAPGGSVVEHVSADTCRFTVGGWSWAGVAGLLATFDADFTVEGPDALGQACATVAARLGRATRTAQAVARSARS